MVALKKLALFSFPSYCFSFLFLVVLGGWVGWASFCQSRNHLFSFTSSWLTSNPPLQAAAPYPPSNILPDHLFFTLVPVLLALKRPLVGGWVQPIMVLHQFATRLECHQPPSSGDCWMLAATLEGASPLLPPPFLPPPASSLLQQPTNCPTQAPIVSIHSF